VHSLLCRRWPHFRCQHTAVAGARSPRRHPSGAARLSVRSPASLLIITQAQETLLTQRAYQIACGYPDATDCDLLRQDPALQLAVDQVPDRASPLASQPTMTRLENAPSRTQRSRMAAACIDVIPQSYAEPPEVIVPDLVTLTVSCTGSNNWCSSMGIMGTGAINRCMSMKASVATNASPPCYAPATGPGVWKSRPICAGWWRAFGRPGRTRSSW